MTNHPHDDLTFELLKTTYSYGKTSDRRVLFTKLVCDELKKRKNPVALDIGCGSGMGVGPTKQKYVELIKSNSTALLGIEPDESVQPNTDIYNEIYFTRFESAPLAESSVDVAFSHFVMEHVDAPNAFLEKLTKILKPGGVYIFITPNGKSYFVRIARLFKKLRLDEFVLSKIKTANDIDSYHYPVVYRFNTERAIRSISEKHGLSVEFAYYERHGARSYFPKSFQWAQRYFNKRRESSKQSDILLNLVCRITKPK